MIRCAFYEKEITPPIGSEIPGYYAARVSTGVLDRLYAKAVVFDDGATQTVLIAVDAVELLEESCRAIAARVRELTGIPEERVAVCSTHTHYGVPQGEVLGAKADEAFMEQLHRLVGDCAYLAQQKLADCTLSFGVGAVDGISFNRDYLMQDGTVRTNADPDLGIVRPYNSNDPELPVLTAIDASGKPIGALISFACHQDCIGVSLFSGDFSSELSRKLKEKYGQDFVSVYIAGASGDINHLDQMHRTRSDYLDMGQKLAAEAIRVMEEEQTAVSGERVRCAKEALTCKYRRATPEQLAEAKGIVEEGKEPPRLMLGSRMYQLLLQYERRMDAKGVAEGQLPVQVMMIGEIPVFALPGEVYSPFAKRIRQSCGGRCLIATLCNGAFGYIPVKELFGTMIYPAQLCEGSMWEPDAGDKITDCAIALAERLRA